MTDTSGAGLSSSNMMTTTVGGFDAVTVSGFMPTTNTYDAVCASRTYVWAGGTGAAGTGTSTGSGSTITGTGTTSGTDSSTGAGSAITDTGTITGTGSSSSAMGGNLIVTVYQTSGTCDQTAMESFATNFLSQFMAGASSTGTGTSGSSTGTGTSDYGTGTATPTP